MNMLNKLNLWVSLAFVVAICALSSCLTQGSKSAQGDQQSAVVQNTKFNPHITAFTSGVVSNQSQIMVRFVEDIPSAKIGEPAPNKVFKISPSIEGDSYWSDNRTLIFKPKSTLRSDQIYKVNVDLSLLLEQEQEGEEAIEDFEFAFSTYKQNVRLELDPIYPYANDKSDNRIIGRLIFSDHIAAQTAHKMLSATQAGKDVQIEWSTLQDGAKYYFTAHNIKRKEDADRVEFKIDAKAIGIKDPIVESKLVPAIGKFEVLDVSIKNNPQSIEIIFTDELMSSQNIDGLISINSKQNFKSQIQKNTVTLFPKTTLSGSSKVFIHSSIVNDEQKPMGADYNCVVEFADTKPQVEYLGKGTILPESSGLNIPFRAIGLRQVQVQVIKIFENNTALFFQNNSSMAGSNNIRQAGRLVLKKTISLDQDKSLDLNKWNSFSIDIDDLVSVDRGAIYRIVLTFRRVNALYPSAASEEELKAYNPAQDDVISEQQNAYYDFADYQYSYYDGYDGSYYNWSDRDNPCKDAYYHSGRFPARNVLASNIGIIAKRGSTNDLLAVVTDLVTTEPLRGYVISIKDYQNQLISAGESNDEGFAHIKLKRTPFIMIVKHEEQRAYMRLDEALALSMTNFDISGLSAQKGLKGYIYGERGVWRPGDDMYLSFMLEDREGTIPVGHPLLFELRGALGQVVHREHSAINSRNLYTFKVPTKNDAKTGNWEARFTIGASVFSKSLKVETVKPNRLKIDLDFDGDTISAAKKSLSAKLSAKWLHGAVADGLKSIVSATLSPVKTQFRGYESYNFDDLTVKYNTSEFTLFEGVTDSVGNATFSKQLSNSYKAPGMLRASVKSRVFEQSGDFSVSVMSLPYSRYEKYTGVRIPKGDKRGILLTDTNHTIDVVSVNENGSLNTKSEKLNYEIIKISWRWWWQTNEENLANYTSSSSRNVIKKGQVTMSDGKGQIQFNIKYPQWGRYLLRVYGNTEEHSTSATFMVDWPGYANKPLGENASAASMLAVETSQNKYKVGEKAQITFASSEGGRALISIENASRVLKEFWVETQKDFTNFSFDVDGSMSPNVYVGVTMLQPHSQTKNNLPLRMYGVVPITVEDESVHLNPQITMPEEIRPGEKVEIKITEKSGEPMSYTVAVVEEGLLDLTNYKTPTPYNYFYAREALGVRSWDIYSSVIGAYGGQIESVFGIGGDEDGSVQSDPTQANRFEAVVRHFGPFDLEKNGERVHEFTMPKYVGSVKTMVVAKSGRKYGSAEKSCPVRQPLMVLATLPRVVSTGERIAVPVTIFTMDDNVKNVDVKLENNDLFELMDDSRKRVEFDKMGNKIVFYNLKVGEKLGVGRVKVVARSGSESAEHEIEIQVRNPNPEIVVSFNGVANASQSVEIPYELIAPLGSNKVSIEASTIAPIDYERRMKYLRSYPHSCVEQTTSAVFPLLYADLFCELSDEDREHNQERINEAISRLPNYNTSDGGFSYWAGQSESSDWGTSYAGHFLLEAEKKGYNLPYNFRNRWIEHQNEKASNWKYASKTSSQLNQAYRLYCLALAGEPNNSAMNRMYNTDNLTQDAILRLAAAYALIGRNEIAQELVNRYSNPSEEDNDSSYGSPLRNQAMQLETMSLLGLDREAVPLIEQISEALSSDKWLSTQELAYSMISLSRWMPKDGKSFAYSYSFDSATSKNVESKSVISLNTIDEPRSKKGVVTLNNLGQSTVFARVVVEGKPAIGKSVSRSSNLKISVEYYDMDAKDIDVKQIKQGSDFIAVVTIRNPSKEDYKDLALTHIVPSGWEIRNRRMYGGELPISVDEPSYTDIRDDRVYSYFDLRSGEATVFALLLNASYKGHFYLPPISCEAMYDNSISANSAGQWIDVN